MKQSKYIPRRVGTSLIKALYFYSKKIVEAEEQSSLFQEDGYTHADSLRTNKKLIKPNDLSSCQSIVKFYDAMREMLEEEKIPQGGFITIAKSSQEKTKYVATPTSIGLVTTTATLKRLLTLSVTVLIGTRGIPICEEQYNMFNDQQSPNFLRIADVIRYIEESGVDVVEMSLDGIEYDFKLDNIQFGSRGYYRNDSDNDVAVAKLTPMISDRYQDSSWGHYLKTLYSGVVSPNKLFPTLSPINKTIALSELKGL